MADLTVPLPSEAVPVVGPDGRMTPEWRRFFTALVIVLKGL